jgi:hypothetical protein
MPRRSTTSNLAASGLMWTVRSNVRAMTPWRLTAMTPTRSARTATRVMATATASTTDRPAVVRMPVAARKQISAITPAQPASARVTARRRTTPPSESNCASTRPIIGDPFSQIALRSPSPKPDPPPSVATTATLTHQVRPTAHRMPGPRRWRGPVRNFVLVARRDLHGFGPWAGEDHA